MRSDTPTVREIPIPPRVVLLHDDPRPCFALADALRDRYVVRIVRSVDEIGENLGRMDHLARVVCVPGRKMRVQAMHDEIERLGVPAERVVVLGVEELDLPEVIEDLHR